MMASASRGKLDNALVPSRSSVIQFRAEIALLENVDGDTERARHVDGNAVIGPAIAEQDDVGYGGFLEEAGQEGAPVANAPRKSVAPSRGQKRRSPPQKLMR
jgi:hypothetical protein